MNTLEQFRIHVASLTGTSAKTHAGILKAWRAYQATKSDGRLVELYRRGSVAGSFLSVTKRREWEKRQAERKRDPDLKRAAKDTAFRKQWVTSLRREARPLSRAVTSAAARVGFGDRLKRLRDINAILQSLGARPVVEPNKPPTLFINQELSTREKRELRERIGGTALDKVAWQFEPRLSEKVVAHTYSDSTCRNGRWRTTEYSSHKIGYQSFGVVLGDGNIWETLIGGVTTRHALEPDVRLSVKEFQLFISVEGIDAAIRAPLHADPVTWRAHLFETTALVSLC